MLKRIQDIKAVGCFSDAHPAALQFEPLTFIYGENCYGKSTLCDIFRSLAEGRPEYVTARVSVPNPNNQRQRVHLSFAFRGNDGEQTLVFDGDTWNPPLPAEVKLLVFDTDFIHRNVFTGLTIERRNQENITQFVLGEEGVGKAKTIKELNSILRALNKEIRQLEADVFSGLPEVEVFVSLVVEESPAEIQNRIDCLRKEIATTKSLRDNLAQAVARKDPQPIALPNAFEAFVSRVDDCLGATYERAHKDAAERVHQHIEHKTQAARTTQQWLRQGLELVRNEECPFCGQPLKAQAQELLAAYRDFFDEAFKQFVSETVAALEKFADELGGFRCVGLPQSIRDNEMAVSQYPELAQDASFRKDTDQLAPSAAALVASWESWQANYEQANRRLSTRIRAKHTSIHTRVDPWQCAEALSAYSHLAQSASQYNVILGQIAERVSDFKRRLDPDAIEAHIRSLESQLSDYAMKQRRQQSTDACIRYATLTKHMSATRQALETLQKELQDDQARFLRDYFGAINTLFSRLGSGPFQISKGEARRGNMPVVQLTASYSGVPITPDRLRAFFSESDRRALALSVFWAKAQVLSDAEKADTILVLDDPVTSFDDGRVDRSIRLMDTARASFRQIIVLSHYAIYLKSFFDRAHQQVGGIQVARITRTQEGSQLELASPADFVETEHQAKFRHIVDFVDRRHSEDVCQDLRVYLETEVKSRYRKQIADNHLQGHRFGDLLDALLHLGSLSQHVRAELEQFRLSLNPGHHIWTGRSQEDKIALASDLLDFIYTRLCELSGVRVRKV